MDKTVSSPKVINRVGIWEYLSQHKDDIYSCLWQDDVGGLLVWICQAAETIDRIAQQPDPLSLGMAAIAKNSDMSFQPVYYIDSKNDTKNISRIDEEIIKPWLRASINVALCGISSCEALALLSEIAYGMASIYDQAKYELPYTERKSKEATETDDCEDIFFFE